MVIELGLDDRNALEALRFDAEATPGYELLKGCLIWADERTDHLSSEGRDYLTGLWAARHRIHVGQPTDAWGFNPERGAYMLAAWNHAIVTRLRWPGMRRIALSAADRAYLEQSEKEANDPNLVF